MTGKKGHSKLIRCGTVESVLSLLKITLRDLIKNTTGQSDTFFENCWKHRFDFLVRSQLTLAEELYIQQKYNHEERFQKSKLSLLFESLEECLYFTGSTKALRGMIARILANLELLELRTPEKTRGK